MQGNAKGKDGRSPNSGLNGHRHGAGGAAAGVSGTSSAASAGDRITSLLNSLFSTVAAQPLSDQLGELVNRLRPAPQPTDSDVNTDSTNQAAPPRR